LKQDQTWHQDEERTTIEVMTEMTDEVEDALKEDVVKELAINVLVTEKQVDPTEEEVTHGGVAIETKNNREYKV
jgi:hypothetical protein